jgi:AcrR family transcriptional regulator
MFNNMNRREASKKETKRLILRAARTLFARKGMEESTIRDIARKAEVSPASIIVHFKTKTALLEEALCGDIENTLTELSVSMQKNNDLLGCIMHLSKGFLKLYDRNRDLYRALIRNTVFEPSSETPIMSKLSEQYIQFLSRIIEDQKTLGMIRSEVDSRIAAAAIFSLYMGALIILLRTPEITVDMVSDILASMTNQYLNGITTGRR